MNDDFPDFSPAIEEESVPSPEVPSAKEKDFSLIMKEIQVGLTGKNNNIPMGFDRLNRYLGLRKRVMSLVFGSSGSGKSAFVNDAWILNPFEHYVKNRSSIRIKVYYFSQERSKIFTICKWLSRKIFLDHGRLITVSRMLGWNDAKMTHDEHDLVLMYEDYIDELTGEFVTIIEGGQNPTSFYKILKNDAESHGKTENVDKFNTIYIPDDSNRLVIPIIDHCGLIKTEKGSKTKKECIDKTMEYMQIVRDLYGMSPVLVSQITRELGSVQYQKLGDFEPTIDHIKESGAIAEACDYVISLFDPLRYNTTDSQYDAAKLRDPNTGAKHFRKLKLLKNSYGEDSIPIGMAMHGATGIFKELPRANEIEEEFYEQVLSGKFYRKDKNFMK